MSPPHHQAHPFQLYGAEYTLSDKHPSSPATVLHIHDELIADPLLLPNELDLFFMVMPQMFTFSLEYVENVRG